MKNSKKARLHKALRAFNQTDVWAMDGNAFRCLVGALRDAVDAGEFDSSVMDTMVLSSRDLGNVQMAGDIAIVPITGMIRRNEDVYTRWYGATSIASLQVKIDQLASDQKVRGILLYIDSPGGDSVANAELSRQIYDLRGKKTVLAFARGQVASAAYYIASAAAKIYITPSTLAGSIGTMSVHEHWHPDDTTFTVVKYGANKAAGSPYAALSKEGTAEMKRIVESYGRQFEQDVARNRGVSVETVRERFGQGSSYMGQAAVDQGLVDGLANTADEVLALFSRSSGSPPPTIGAVAQPVVLLSGTTAAIANVSQENTSPADPAVATLRHDSTPAAGASAVSNPRSSTMNPKIRAALWVRGLVEAADAADEICQVALNAFFQARNQSVPTEDSKILAALNGTEQAQVIQSVATPLQAAPAAAAAPANPVQAAHDREQAEARAQQLVQAERTRVKTIRERGKVLGVSQEQIDAAIESNDSVESVVNGWVASRATTEPPLGTGGSITSSETGQAAFVRDAVDAISLRAGLRVENASVQARRWAEGGAPLSYFARQCLALNNARRPDWESAEDVAKAALEMESNNLAHHVLSSDSSPYNRPASFPNLLSALANKALNEGVGRANPTYEQWTGVMRSEIPDFKAAPSVAKSTVYTLDEVVDGKDYQEFVVAEEILSAIQIRRYGNAFGWTPALVANDDLGAFVEAGLGIVAAGELTINNLCIGLITGNPYLLDGYQLIDDTNHGNQVTTGNGGAPSTTQWTKMKLKIQAQRPVGGKGYIREPLKVVLVPPALNEAALQTFAAFGQVPEVKNPTTDATINVYRGMATVVEEPELQAYTSTKWWAFADPSRAPAIKRGYFRGWGPSGRRETWWDPRAQTQWVSYEIRVGVAISDYRVVVENFGA